MIAGLGERLRDERKRLGYDQRGFATAAGISRNTQLAYEQGKPGMTVEYLFRIAELGADIDRIVSGGADPDDAVQDRRRGFGHRDDESMSSDLDLVAVSGIDLSLGLGGTYADGHIEVQVQHFSRSWLESITRTHPSLLTFAHGRGDSMMPTLMDGDIILIDRSQQTILEQDAIWALVVGDIAMVKRVRIRGERVTLLSDNDRVPPDEALPEEVKIVGRVIFIGRRI